MHIMLFGGSFDPPHMGHHKVAQHVVQSGICDELWFIPCRDHAFNKNMTPSTDRVAMLRLLSVPGTKIELYELEKTGKSYSYETLCYFRQTQPQNTFSWLIGADQLAVFHKWYKYQELLHDFQVYVYPRAGFATDSLQSGMTLLSDLPQIDASSTLVRQKMAAGESIADLVLPGVASYIHQFGLYNQA